MLQGHCCHDISEYGPYVQIQRSLLGHQAYSLFNTRWFRRRKIVQIYLPNWVLTCLGPSGIGLWDQALHATQFNWFENPFLILAVLFQENNSLLCPIVSSSHNETTAQPLTSSKSVWPLYLPQLHQSSGQRVLPSPGVFWINIIRYLYEVKPWSQSSK